MIRYSDNKKYAFFNGLKFTRDEKTGYYLNSTLRVRLHRHVWETVNGKIPKGYHVHHIDSNKGSNEPANLELILGIRHVKHHMAELTEEQREWLRNNLDQKARPKASEWHGSEEGRKWHKKHYDEMKDSLHKKETKTCVHCGIEFEGYAGKRDRFCSNKCKSAWRRKEGLDNETRICGYCRKEYTINKYAKTTVCSKSCSMLLYPRHHKLNQSKKD